MTAPPKLEPDDRALRRLLPLAFAIVFVDNLFFAALTPLLPTLTAALGLDKGEAGILVGSYAVGVLLGALPGGLLASRLGVKRTAYAGIGLTTLASLGFGLSGSLAGLVAARVAGGLGSAFSWSAATTWLIERAPRERRGEMIGMTISAAVAGSLLGPLVGALAAAAGMGLAFGLVAAADAALIAWAAATPGVPLGAPPPLRRILVAAGRRPLAAGLAFVLLAPLLFSVLGVLAPLELARLGWGAGAIGALYLVTAAVETLLHPAIGRWVDRAGVMAPTRTALAACVVVLAVIGWLADPWLLAVAVGAAALSFGAMLVPGMSVATQAGDAAGLGSAPTIGLVNLAWAVGYALGAPAGGALAQAASDIASYSALAAICVAGFIAVPLLRGTSPGGKAGA